jgi:protoheme IX farnesyltransferase
MLPWAFDLTGFHTAWTAAFIALIFSLPAALFYINRTNKRAKLVMFASFFYLPIIQLIYLIDKF